MLTFVVKEASNVAIFEIDALCIFLNIKIICEDIVSEITYVERGVFLCGCKAVCTSKTNKSNNPPHAPRLSPPNPNRTPTTPRANASKAFPRNKMPSRIKYILASAQVFRRFRLSARSDGWAFYFLEIPKC